MSMIDMAIKGRPSTKAEIRQILNTKAAFGGYSLATLAVKELQLAPYVLKNLLNGVTSHGAHPSQVAKINEITGATMAAWEQ